MKRLSVRAPRSICLIAFIGTVLTACGTGAPVPVIYVLGPPANAVNRVEPLAGRPRVELKPVLVPDYLDISEIMVRRAENVVAPRLTGRWGERLSVGVTRALALDMQRRLPEVMMASYGAYTGQPALEVLVSLEAFEARADGTVVLVAQWQLVDLADHHAPAPERVSLTEPAGEATDAAIAAGMSRAVDQLAVRIADAVGMALQQPRER